MTKERANQLPKAVRLGFIRLARQQPCCGQQEFGAHEGAQFVGAAHLGAHVGAQFTGAAQVGSHAGAHFVSDLGFRRLVIGADHDALGGLPVYRLARPAGSAGR